MRVTHKTKPIVGTVFTQVISKEIKLHIYSQLQTLEKCRNFFELILWI